MHWPLAFIPGREEFPKGEDGKVLIDNEVTLEEVITPIVNAKG